MQPLTAATVRVECSEARESETRSGAPEAGSAGAPQGSGHVEHRTAEPYQDRSESGVAVEQPGWKRWLRIGEARKKPREKRCLCCGRCCELFGGRLHASRADLERWKELGRTDLLQRVNRLDWIWCDPVTGKQEERCPFLQRTGPDTALCAIHDVKPDICRDYPTLAHGHRCLRGSFLCWAGALASTGDFVMPFLTLD